MTGRGLSAVSDADLVALSGAVERGEISAPFTATALQSRGLGHLVSALAPYLKLDAEGLRAVAEVALAERAHANRPKLSLVWTGEDPRASFARHSGVLLSELFERARESVLVAGYSFDHSETLFPTLHTAMKERGVKADFFVDVGQMIVRLKTAATKQKKKWALLSMPLRQTKDPVQRGRAVVDLFFSLMWPFDGPKPTVYFHLATAGEKQRMNMHAKCVVIDHGCSLVTSANFTSQGQTRNVEAGVLVEDRPFAAALERQWSSLVEAGVMNR